MLCTYACQLILPINSVSKPCQDVDLFVVSIVLVYTFPQTIPKNFTMPICVFISGLPVLLIVNYVLGELSYI